MINGQAVQNATATYDALGRMTSWSEAGSNATSGSGAIVIPQASKSWAYDAVGNVRHVSASFRDIMANNTLSSYVDSRDYWYRYDAANRVVTSQGRLSNGAIVRGPAGTDILYDAAGQRVASLRDVGLTANVYDPTYTPPHGGGGHYGQQPYDGEPGGYHDVYYTGTRREDYGYDAKGALASVRIADSGYQDNGDGTVTATQPPATGQLKSLFTTDLLGRVTRQQDFTGDGAGVAYDRQATYDARGHVTSETVSSRQGSDSYQTTTYNNYGEDTAGYALGALLSSTSYVTRNNQGQPTTSTVNGYAWYDGAVQSTVAYKPNVGQGTTYTTSYAYGATGVLQSAYVADGRPRSITVVNDALGQAIHRDEADNNTNATTGGDPHEAWYRFDGRQIGYIGNNGTQNTDYATSIAQRTAAAPTSGAFRNGTTGYVTADFDQNYDAINSYGQGAGGGSYTVRGGDTLGAIAQQLWGDANLWYKLAEANGLSAASALTEGTTLTIPSGINRTGNSATTSRPYDPSDAYGDTSPTTPKPQKNNKCGVFGAILLVAIAVAVTVVTSGAAAAGIASAATGTSVGLGAGIGLAFGGTLAGAGIGLSAVGLATVGAIGAAAGSIVSQGIGVATGLQDKFSWKGVALAGISGGIGGGLGGAFPGGGPLAAAARGAAGSAITQGIGVATGLQSKFDFAGVAAAGIGSGIGAWAGGKLGATSLADLSVRNIGANLLTSAADGIANAATRSLVNGTDFGNNLMTALPDIIGSTIGNLVANGIAGQGSEAAKWKRNLAAVKNDQEFGEYDVGKQAFIARGAGLLSDNRNERIADVLADADNRQLFRDAVNGEYNVDRVTAASAILSRAGVSDTEIAAATQAVGQHANLSRPAQFIGMASQPNEITVTASMASLAIDALDGFGGFIKDNVSSPWLSTGLFLYGAVTAPVSTFVLTALSYTPGVGSAISRLEDGAIGFIADKAQAFASEHGIDLARTGRVALGALGIVGGAVLGYKSIPLLQKGVKLLGSRFAVVERSIGGVGNEIGILRDAARGKGNFGLGQATAQEAARLGESWVGTGYTIASDGKTLISSDGLRQFRPPSFKPKLGIKQSNFEQRLHRTGQWQSNGHLDIVP